MAKTILIDEIHLSFYVPRSLSDAKCDAIRTILNDAIFLRQLRRSVRDVLRLYPALGSLRSTVTR